MPIREASPMSPACSIPGTEKKRVETPGFMDLPIELKVALIKLDADAAFSLSYTCKEFAQLVFSELTPALFGYFQNSPTRSLSFVNAALATRKSGDQLVRFSSRFLGLNRGSLSRLVDLDILTPRSYNALSRFLLQYMNMPKFLLHSYTRDLPLLGDEELSRPEEMQNPESEQGDVHLSGLDLVLLEYAPRLKEQGFRLLYVAQMEASISGGKNLIPVHGQSVCDVDDIATRDAATVGSALKRFLSAKMLSELEARNTLSDGVLYRIAFPPAPPSPPAVTKRRRSCTLL